MEFKAVQIAEILNGTIEGNDQVSVQNLAGIEEAREGCIAFLANEKYENHLYSTAASIVIINKSLVLKKPVSATLIRVNNAYESFTGLLRFYESQVKEVKVGIESPNYVGEGSVLGERCYQGAFSYIGKESIIADDVQIYPQVYIGDHVTIGAGTILYSGCKIYAGTTIGEHCIIHAGAVIGSDGFGFASSTDGNYQKIPQLGTVVIGNDVEIGANTTIDRATMSKTIIQAGSKLDNLVQVGHNVIIGERTVIASQTGVSGSTKIGKECMIGGQVGFAGHIKIGDKVKIGAQSGLNANVQDGKTLMGTPAMDFKNFLKVSVVMKTLPELRQTIRNLEKKIIHLEEVKKESK